MESAKFAVFPFLRFSCCVFVLFFCCLFLNQNFGESVNGKLVPVLRECVRREDSAQMKVHASTDLASRGRASMLSFFLGQGGGWLLRVTWNTILFFCTSTHTHTHTHRRGVGREGGRGEERSVIDWKHRLTRTRTQHDRCVRLLRPMS